MHTEDQNGARLDSLLAAYRDACPDPESASVDFMPNLWRKIEAKRIDTTFVFRRLAQFCMAATAALLLLTSLITPRASDDEMLYSSTYADVLAADHADAAYVESLPADLPEVNR
ncbi:MAG: hypothetical protein ABIR70_13820 [Bryobacteraceae bacterium]